MSETTTPRPVNAGPRTIKTIAADIRTEWTKGGKQVYFAALPFLDAMDSLEAMTDRFGDDDAEYVVLRFLSNAAQFKGPQARLLKEELRALLPGRR